MGEGTYYQEAAILTRKRAVQAGIGALSGSSIGPVTELLPGLENVSHLVPAQSLHLCKFTNERGGRASNYGSLKSTNKIVKNNNKNLPLRTWVCVHLNAFTLYVFLN